MDNLTLQDTKFTKNVYTCAKDERIEAVIDELRKKKIGSVIIVENNKPIGIFTERDFLLKIGLEQEKVLEHPISDYMTANPKTCAFNCDLIEVLQTMNQGGFRHMIVVNENGELEGVASIKDLFNSLITLMQQPGIDYSFMQQFFTMIA